MFIGREEEGKEVVRGGCGLCAHNNLSANASYVGRKISHSAGKNMGVRNYNFQAEDVTLFSCEDIYVRYIEKGEVTMCIRNGIGLC